MRAPMEKRNIDTSESTCNMYTKTHTYTHTRTHKPRYIHMHRMWSLHTCHAGASHNSNKDVKKKSTSFLHTYIAEPNTCTIFPRRKGGSRTFVVSAAMVAKLNNGATEKEMHVGQKGK